MSKVLYLHQIPKCQFCELFAVYEAVSTDPKTLHNWVYVCQTHMSAKTIDDDSIRIIQLAE